MDEIALSAQSLSRTTTFKQRNIEEVLRYLVERGTPLDFAKRVIEVKSKVGLSIGVRRA